MLVQDILKEKNREVVTIRPEDTVETAMTKLLENKISCLPVLSADGELAGIVSDKDIFRTAYEYDARFKRMLVKEVMTTDLIIGVLDDDLNYIAAIMTNNRIRHVPIMDEGRMVNLLSVGDIIKAQLRDLKVTNRYLRMYIEGSYPG
jgi:CBS domain-containing protein